MRTNGFTFIECIFVLLLVSILLRCACTGFGSFLERQYAQLTAIQLLEAFQHARTEAIMQNTVLGICGSQDHQHCDDDWSHGYVIFKGTLEDISQKISPENILYTVSVNAHNVLMHSDQSAYYFTGEGMCLNRGTFHLDNIKGNNFKSLVIFDSGRVRLTDPRREKTC